MPEELYELVLEQYGKEIADKIKKGHEKEKYVTLRVNTIKSNMEEVKQELAKEAIKFKEVNWYKDALIIENVKEYEIKKLSIYTDGKIYLQSLSSMLPPLILEPKAGDNILDMTAAPGSKTTQIAALTDNKAMITACEKNKIRTETLLFNLERQGVRCVNVMQQDARKLSDYFSFDKILLDAPCSGSGTESIKNIPDINELVERSSKTQTELLTKALKILKPGCEMIYSTCSILSKENEEVLRKVLNKSNAEIVPIKPFEGIQVLPVSLEGTLCVCPNEFFEGFFVAKIIKSIN